MTIEGNEIVKGSKICFESEAKSFLFNEELKKYGHETNRIYDILADKWYICVINMPTYDENHNPIIN